MEGILVYPVGTGSALSYAAEYLHKHNIPLTDHPTPEVTHLMVDVPSREIPVSLLERLPEKITVVGGNLNLPVLEGYRCMDLLKDERYLAKNAAITAECALRVAGPHMKSIFAGTPILVIGWGRIGKCLGQLLKNMGALVTVAARKHADRAMLEALGYRAADTACLDGLLGEMRAIFNTAPETILRNEQLALCRNCVKIDLASRPGLCGDNVLWARGLPGIHAPESSGNLIAETFLRLLKEESS